MGYGWEIINRRGKNISMQTYDGSGRMQDDSFLIEAILPQTTPTRSYREFRDSIEDIKAEARRQFPDPTAGMASEEIDPSTGSAYGYTPPTPPPTPTQLSPEAAKTLRAYNLLPPQGAAPVDEVQQMGMPNPLDAIKTIIDLFTGGDDEKEEQPIQTVIQPPSGQPPSGGQPPPGGQQGGLLQQGDSDQQRDQRKDGDKKTVVVPPSFTPTDPVYDPFPDLSWNTTYRGFVDQHKITSPQMYQHIIEQGLSSNPLTRTAQTQFLLQGDYRLGSTDPSFGTNASLASAMQNYEVDDREGNPYWDFLEQYVPLKGKQLTDTIDAVIANLDPNAPMIDATSKDLSRRDMKQARWRQRFGIGEGADLRQQQLAALPIFEHTSPALKNEIAGVLSTLYSNWLVSPDRQDQDSWLEYVRGKNYFGLVPDNVLGNDYRGRKQVFEEYQTEGEPKTLAESWGVKE